MADQPLDKKETVSPQPAESVEADDAVKDEDAAEEGAEGGDGISRELYKEMRAICDVLTNHRIEVKGDEDYYPSSLFRRIPNKKHLPEYHAVIQEPRALSTLKQKITTKKYPNFAEFVRDFALIVHNAQVFNRPKSSPVNDVFILKTIFDEELSRLVELGLITEEDSQYPDLGAIPDASPEPEARSEDEEDGDDDEDDEDDEGDDSDEDGKTKKGRRRGRRASGTGQKGADGDPRKRRGRPPRVDTPMEARIKAVLKGIRKFRSDEGHLKVLTFERLPDKTQFPDYYTEIAEPIAIDQIRRKAKRKKYQSMEHFMKDMQLMFNNAMRYNEDESSIYKDAKELWDEAKKIAILEKQKPDTEYLMEDGRLPLPNGILHNGELWKIGDWVHIQNPNDVTKPIVSQIYRTWVDVDGQQWVNACWYYRPEQTVHQYEKHFYPNEVVKTGQYRDHRIDEIIDRCFVMFITRFSRGRPRGLDTSKEIYVCEARYNEEKHKLNKIKTWASCLPDEVRDQDYEMDLFKTPKRIRKITSPIKHLLKADAKETDPLPPVTWGRENAPPIVGAVHRQPRDENQSPPPEPTPPPPTPPVQPIRQYTNTALPRPHLSQGADAQGDIIMSNAARIAASTPHGVPQLVPNMLYQQTPGPPGQGVPRLPSYAQAHPSYASPGLPQSPSHVSTPSFPPQANLSGVHPGLYPGSAIQGQGFPPRTMHLPQQHAAITPSYQQAPPASPFHRAPIAQRFPEVYVLPDAANAAIPHDIRSQYPSDEKGKILWFTSPPINTSSGSVISTENDSSQDQKQTLKHSLAYIAARAKRQKLIGDRNSEIAFKGQLEEAAAAINAGDVSTSSSAEQDNQAAATFMAPLLADRPEQQRNSDDSINKHARAVREYEVKRAAENREKYVAKTAYFAQKEREQMEKGLREVRLQGTVFRDDWDERY